MFDFLKRKKEKSDKDCPVELLDVLDSSKSEWRKTIIKQFIEQHDWRVKIEAKLKRIEWQNAAIIGFLIMISLLLLRLALSA